MAAGRSRGPTRVQGPMRPTHGEFAHLSNDGRIKLSLDAVIRAPFRAGQMVAVTWDPDRQELSLASGGKDDCPYFGSGICTNRIFGVGRYTNGRYQVAFADDHVTVQMRKPIMVEERKR